MSTNYTPERRLVCEICGRSFKEYRTAEEALLQAIYGEKPLCKECYSKKDLVPCSNCGTLTNGLVLYEGKPYCSRCLELF